MVHDNLVLGSEINLRICEMVEPKNPCVVTPKAYILIEFGVALVNAGFHMQKDTRKLDYYLANRLWNIANLGGWVNELESIVLPWQLDLFKESDEFVIQLP